MAHIEIDDETMAMLAAQAAERGVTPAEMVALIVATLSAPNEPEA